MTNATPTPAAAVKTPAAPEAPVEAVKAKAPEAVKAVATEVSKDKKRKYLVVGGKTFVRDENNEEVKYVAGDVVELTEAEARGRQGQVEIYKAEVE